MSAWRYFQACAGHVSGAVEIRRQHSCVPIRAGKTVIVTCLPRLEPRSLPALFALTRGLEERYYSDGVVFTQAHLPTPPHLPGGGVFHGHLLWDQLLSAEKAAECLGLAGFDR